MVHCMQLLYIILGGNTLYNFWSFGINDSNTFSIENWIPLKPVLLVLKIEYLWSRCWGRERCCTFLYLSWRDSMKPSLQFSFLYFGLVALEGRLFTRIFIAIDQWVKILSKKRNIWITYSIHMLYHLFK